MMSQRFTFKFSLQILVYNFNKIFSGNKASMKIKMQNNKRNNCLKSSSKYFKLKQFKAYAHFTPIKYSRHHNDSKKLNLDCFSIDLEQKGVNMIGNSSKLQNDLLYSRSEVIKTQASNEDQSNSKSLPKIIFPNKIMQNSQSIIKQNRRSREIINAVLRQKEREQKIQRQRLKLFKELQTQRRNFQKQFERLEIQYVKQQYMPSKKSPLKMTRQIAQHFQSSQQSSFRQNTSKTENLNEFLIKDQIRRLSINDKEIVITLDRQKKYNKIEQPKY